MAVLARADREALRAALADGAPLPGWTRLRGPETGLLMLRGRMGGDGQAFNLTETTITRCTVSMDGRMGHATVLGRDAAHAELAAAIDAAMQDAAFRETLRQRVIEPLAAAQEAARARDARRAEATRVRFHTMAAMR